MKRLLKPLLTVELMIFATFSYSSIHALPDLFPAFDTATIARALQPPVPTPKPCSLTISGCNPGLRHPLFNDLPMNASTTDQGEWQINVHLVQSRILNRIPQALSLKFPDPPIIQGSAFLDNAEIAAVRRRQLLIYRPKQQSGTIVMWRQGLKVHMEIIIVMPSSLFPPSQAKSRAINPEGTPDSTPHITTFTTRIRNNTQLTAPLPITEVTYQLKSANSKSAKLIERLEHQALLNREQMLARAKAQLLVQQWFEFILSMILKDFVYVDAPENYQWRRYLSGEATASAITVSDLPQPTFLKIGGLTAAHKKNWLLMFNINDPSDPESPSPDGNAEQKRQQPLPTIEELPEPEDDEADINPGHPTEDQEELIIQNIVEDTDTAPKPANQTTDLISPVITLINDFKKKYYELRKKHSEHSDEEISDEEISDMTVRENRALVLLLSFLLSLYSGKRRVCFLSRSG